MNPPRNWKLTAVLLTLNTGVSVIAFVVAVGLMTQAGIGAALAAFIGIALLLHTLISWSIVSQLTRLTIAITYLHQSIPVTPLAVSAAHPLKPLIDAVNALIQERADLKTMRGHLVEQITAAAAQEERNRLARDLHDSIKQQVFSMSISAAAAYAHLDSNPQATRAALQDVKQSAQEAMVEMRALLQQLSPAPLEKSGLVQALREQSEALAYRTGAAVETHFGALPGDDQLPPGTQETLFRIAQEALSNIARHARARTVRLTLETDEHRRLTLRIVDDGQGFDPQQAGGGMGLNNIRTRAAGISAQVDIHTEVGAGTDLTITVPLVEQIEQETIMQAHYETQLKPVVASYYRFANGLAVFIIVASLLLWRVLSRPDPIGQDVILLLLFAGLTLVAVAALPYALWSLLRARPQAAALLLSAGRNSRVDYALRRNLRMVYIIISIAAAWFLPILSIGLQITPWLRVGIGVFFLGLVLWNYKRMGDLYRHELALTPKRDRLIELDKRLAEVRSSWLTILLVIPVIVGSALIGGDIQIPPQEPDHWMNVSFVVMAALLLLNQIISARVYRRWRTEAEQAA
ncbi:MAG: sensor histidine kinase [bacterium]|nr:sensor histidine kinase [bacterium]